MHVKTLKYEEMDRTRLTRFAEVEKMKYVKESLQIINKILQIDNL